MILEKEALWIKALFVNWVVTLQLDVSQ